MDWVFCVAVAGATELGAKLDAPTMLDSIGTWATCGDKDASTLGLLGSDPWKLKVISDRAW